MNDIQPILDSLHILNSAILPFGIREAAVRIPGSVPLFVFHLASRQTLEGCLICGERFESLSSWSIFSIVYLIDGLLDVCVEAAEF